MNNNTNILLVIIGLLVLLGLSAVLLKIQRPIQQSPPIIIENVHPNYNIGYEHARIGLRPSLNF